MVELMRTSDPVLVGFIQALMESERIPIFVADASMSALEGGIGAFPRRVLVPSDWLAQARRVVTNAGLAAELRHER